MPLGTGGELTGGGGGSGGGGTGPQGPQGAQGAQGASGAAFGPLSGDVTTTGPGAAVATLAGTANVESIIRANALNQFATATGDYSMGTHRIKSLQAGILSTDAADLGQLGADGQRAYVVSGCVWTADAVGSTRLASMTSGTVMIAGILLTVAAVTSRTFTASSDTYVDATDNGDGTALLTYTTVTNNSLSPALALSGTVLNTIRLAVLTVGASNIAATSNIIQGSPITATNTGGALGSSTVAAGSNGSAITATPLNVAAGASFSTGGGWAQVVHSTQTYTIQFTGVSANTLTGVTVLSGTGTVSTGDSVTQVFPVSVTDFLGNPIYATRPYPTLIGMASFNNTFTTTQVAAVPVPGLIAPFVIPAGPARQVEVAVASPFWTSSAAVGTTLTATATFGNSVSSPVNISPGLSIKTSVASDGTNLVLIAGLTPPLAPGSYTAQLTISQGAAGTMTLGVTYGASTITAKLV